MLLPKKHRRGGRWGDGKWHGIWNWKTNREWNWQSSWRRPEGWTRCRLLSIGVASAPQSLLCSKSFTTYKWKIQWVIFHFSISHSPRLSLSPKFGLRPNISQKNEVVYRFDLTQRIAQRLTETKPRTGLHERSLNPKLINSSVDFACTRYVNQLEIRSG